MAVYKHGFGKLELVSSFTIALLFGVIAGLAGLLLWYSGYSGYPGIILSLLLTVVIMFLQWWFSPSLLKLMLGLKELELSDAPKLHQIIEKLCRQADLPKPRLYLVRDPTPNAFAFGRRQKDANIAVHQGLLDILDTDEVESVLAHELGHIKHRDMILMTIASMIPVFLYYISIMLLSGSSRDRERDYNPFAVFIGGMLARLFGQLIVLWLSRTREYYADAFSGYLTDPNNMVSALAKISGKVEPTPNTDVMRAFYVADPLSPWDYRELAQAVRMEPNQLQQWINAEKGHGFMELFSTHPLTTKRILALKKLQKQF